MCLHMWSERIAAHESDYKGEGNSNHSYDKGLCQHFSSLKLSICKIRYNVDLLILWFFSICMEK